ncbi:unnamed protein product [Adineta steineri]|uniref:Uncharacterized protein n=1 Tax=Adineta steineri TaxID=433720 RepID=A0A815GYW4_9BILA|nr:unnamed protein product [Adineta steineri]CAF3927334.1 unnamed protein product [Adineta steineri]
MLQKIWCPILFIIVTLEISLVIIGSVGTANYVRDKHDESIYRSTMCYVTHCDTFESTYYYATGSPTTTYWNVKSVLYNISDGRLMNSTIATDMADPSHKVNETYKCYYESTNVKSVRWNLDNPQKYLIMLCVAWPMLALLLVGFIAYELKNDCFFVGKCCNCICTIRHEMNSMDTFNTGINNAIFEG